MFDQLFASLTDGMLVGVVYGLAAMGLTLIFGVMNVINLAHGPIIALGMFGVYLCYTVLGLNPFIGPDPDGHAGPASGRHHLLGRRASGHRRAPSVQPALDLLGQHDHHRHRHGRLFNVVSATWTTAWASSSSVRSPFLALG